MPYVTCQVVIPTVDNVAANYATNTLHFFVDDETDIPAVEVALKAMYSTLSANMSNLVRATNWQFKWYLDTDPEPRAPIVTTSWNTGLTFSNAPLPTEVSLCISFQGDQVSGVPQARKRGRIYIPFITQASNGADGRPSGATVTQFVSAGNGLLTASEPGTPWRWVVYSAVAPGYSEVTNGWVDNEWDTQRRRGRPYTSRTLFT